MTGFALPYIENMFILMILNDFCLLPAQFRYIILPIQTNQSQSHIATDGRSVSQSVSQPWYRAPLWGS
jgi:hypothetical protein